MLKKAASIEGEYFRLRAKAVAALACIIPLK
jgi:hypothetical protein